MIRRHKQNNKTSLFENLSLIEKLCMIGLPIGLTFILHILIGDIFGFITIVSLLISITSTITLIGLIVLLVNYLTER